MISGKEWLGEKFTNAKKSYSFTFDVTSIYPNSTVDVTSLFYNENTDKNDIQTRVNNTSLPTFTIDGAENKSYGRKATLGQNTHSINQLNVQNPLTVTYSLNSSGNDLSVYLDKIRVNLKRRLQPYKPQVFFQTINSLEYVNAAYKIENVSSNHLIFDISEPTDIKNVNYHLMGNTITFTNSNSSSSLSRFVLFNRFDGFPTPTFVEETKNQNLHADVNNIPTLLIITPPFLEEKAKEYAQMKLETVNIDAIVRTTNDIYNEFSSGAKTLLL